MTDAELIEAGLLSPEDPDRHMRFVDGEWVAIPPVIVD